MKADYVYDVEDVPQSNDFQIGIVVSLDKKHKQMHCGVAYDLMSSINILHLKTHKKPKHDTEWGDFLCVVKPSLSTIEQELLIPYFDAIKESIKEGHHVIPYGFRYLEFATIDSQGQLTLGAHGSGLTCATYVLTLFHSNGFDLVELRDWPSREEDNNWFDGILLFFLRFAVALGFSKKNLVKIMEEKGCPRIRPEEAAVSLALYNNSPAQTQTIMQEGNELKEYLYEKLRTL